jgi:sec-independent protein translocase protein TatA
MGTEWIVVIIIAVVLFGGSQIPKLARSLGQAQKEFKKGISDGADDEKSDGSKPSD